MSKRMGVGRGVPPVSLAAATPKQRQKSKERAKEEARIPTAATWDKVPSSPNSVQVEGATRICGFHAKMFDVGDPDSRAEYEALYMTTTGINPMGTTIILGTEQHTEPDPGKVNRRIFVKWADLEFRRVVPSDLTGGQPDGP